MKEKKTNLDVIKERMVNASDEEVADLCYRTNRWGFDCSKRTCFGSSCRQCFLDWLNEEADEMPLEETLRALVMSTKEAFGALKKALHEALESTEEKNDD